MKKLFIMMLVILASLHGLAQHYIQGSLQQGTAANKADITFLPNYTNPGGSGEYLSYVSISVAIPSASATGVIPAISPTGNLAGVVFVQATPFSYTSGGEKIFSWICNNLTVTNMAWTNGLSFTGATITFNGGTGASKVRLVDFTNNFGGNNGNTLFSVVTNVSPFDVTNFSDFFYAISNPNGSTKGNYPNGDFYVETNTVISMGACNPSPNAGTVSGTSPLCIAGTATYTSSGDAGGTWSSSNTVIATVDATTGLVTVLAAGTTNITYTVIGCSGNVSSFATLTVNSNVSAGTVIGTSPLCIVGTSIYSSNGTAGGAWSSTNTSVATVNATTGVVTAIAAGNTNITYIVNNGCGSPVSSFVTLIVNSNVSAGTVNGTSPLCIGGTSIYSSNGTSGGIWSSTNTSVATVNATTGAVTAIAAGTSNITYSVNSGCGSPVSSFATLTVNVNVSAGTVNGATALIAGSTATYASNGTAGGTWSSSNTTAATVNSSTGVVTAIAAGTTNISYTVNNGCGAPATASKTLTVTIQPFIQGSIKQGAANNMLEIAYLPNYTSAASEYLSYTSISIAIPSASATGVTPTIAGSGNLNGVVFVQATPFSYTNGSETIFSWICNNLTETNMSWTNGVPFTGATITLAGGTGSSKVRLVDFTNLAGGTNGNTLFAVVTNVSPFDVTNFTDFFYAISGANGSTEGTYGNADQYVETNQLINLGVCNVSANSGTISGTSPLCIGGTATYSSNGSAGGVWSSTNTNVATVNATTGMVIALTAGTTNITYTVTGCSGNVSSSATLTVNSNVSAGTVSITSPLCIGGTATYSSIGTAGGTWSSTNTNVATINPTTAVVTAIAAGNTNITYTLNSGCGSPVSSFATLTVNVNVSAGTVSGTSPLCIGGTSTYSSNGTAGAVWNSTNTSVATVNATTGAVTAIAAGTANITYTVNSGCGSPVSSFKILTVNANVSAGTVTGATALITGNTAAYSSNGTTSGTWSSSNTAAATVNSSTGVVTAIAAGTTNITYTVNSGCGSPVSSFSTLTVTGQPSIQGSVQQGPVANSVNITFLPNYTSAAGEYLSYVSLSIAIPSASAASVTPTITGTGNLAGVVFVAATPFSYTNGSETIYSWICNNLTETTMSWTNAVSFTGATINFNGVTGTSKVRLVDFTNIGGGTNGNTLFAVVTNVSPFDVTNFTDFFYAINGANGSIEGTYGNADQFVETNQLINLNACNASPNAGTINGISPLCIGGTATYSSNGNAGGTWSNSNTGIATVDATTGVVTAIAPGTTNITYTVLGCNGNLSSFATLTVNNNVNAGTVSGASPLCIGGTTTYNSNGTPGGVWSSTNPNVATVNTTTGAITATGAGTTDITYTVGNGCSGPASSFAALTVNANVSAGILNGVSPLCILGTSSYSSNGTTGGVWSSTNTNVATVNTTTGAVTAVAAGTTNITYTVNNGCGSPVTASKTLTVSPNVNAGIVSGSSPLNVGATASYSSNGTTGGSWSSSNNAVATVNTITGLVTALATGTTDIIYTVNSGCGAPASAFKTLTVNLAVSITIICPGNKSVSTNNCSKSITISNPGYSGTVTSLAWVMNGATTLNSPATGINYVGTKTFNVGVTTITYTAKDAAGNTATCSFTVAVTEDTRPTINCLSNISSNATTGLCGKTITVPNPSVSDNCGVASVTWLMTGATTGTSPATGINYVGTRTFNVGTTTITYTVKDASGNKRTCSFTVRVVDHQDPVIVCPADIHVVMTTGCSKSIAVPDPVYSDNCSVTTVAWLMLGATNAISPLSGINTIGTKDFNVGVTLVTYAAKDASGNISTCLFTVTVEDNIDPTISCPGNITQNAGNNCSKQISTTNPVFSDNCNVTRLTWTMNGATTGSSWPLGINYVGTRSFNKGITTVTYTVRDLWGNDASCSFTVMVTDNTNPVISCPGNITQNSNNCSKTVNTSNPWFNDNCGVTTLAWIMTGATSASSPATGINYVGNRAFNAGTTTVTYTVKDASGNTASSSFTVRINGPSNCNLRTAEPVVTTNPTHPGATIHTKITVSAFPNPAEQYFNLAITTDKKEEVEIRVTDITGKSLQVLRGSPDKVYRIGDGWMQGTYVVEVIQGTERAITRVVKL